MHFFFMFDISQLHVNILIILLSFISFTKGCSKFANVYSEHDLIKTFSPLIDIFSLKRKYKQIDDVLIDYFTISFDGFIEHLNMNI
jgi:hypothetical protein